MASKADFGHSDCSHIRSASGGHVIVHEHLRWYRFIYRYTLDELPAMLEKLKKKSEQFREWAEAVQNALDPDTPKTCDLDGLRAHLKRAHDLKMHKTELVRALETAIEDAEKCASVIAQLDLNKMRTRTRQHDPKYRLTIHELTLFAAEIDGLACVLPEGNTYINIALRIPPYRLNHPPSLFPTMLVMAASLTGFS
ncbi:hypothetical protein B5X24_HaOG215082 [Helicoverpa armigera]|uniref:Lysine-specific demethylase-like domain-containing protein n=1 Tax=Helicoverpa armigera TaxID=29058 RepID=A0A2W1BCQ5_HELAM|nr:hypothetical protein B5X24_HaOG215082 [Helicoverpa armigera]